MQYHPHDYQTYATNFILEHPVAAVLLVITVLVLSLAPMDTPRTRLVTAILMVTVQYAAAIGLIFSVNGMLKKDKMKRKETQEKENA